MLNFVLFLLNNNLFFFFAIILCIFTKLILVSVLIYYNSHSKQLSKLWLLLICVICSSLLGDVAGFTKLLRILFFSEVIARDFVMSLIRIGWAFLVVQYQAFALFLDNFIFTSFRIRKGNLFFIGISFILFSYFIYDALFCENFLSKDERNYYLAQSLFATVPLEIAAMKITSIFLLIQGIWSLFLLYFSFRETKNIFLPKILKKQILTLMGTFIVPFFLYDFIMVIHFFWRSIHIYSPILVGFSNLFLTAAMSYCMYRVIRLRFLNCKELIESSPRPSFIYQFKEIIEELHSCNTIEKLNLLTEHFFETNFSISSCNVVLLLRDYSSSANNTGILINNVEQLINNHGLLVCPIIKEEKILVYDDLALNNFYNSNEGTAKLLSFLDSISADVFLPIIEKERMIAFIVIQKAARKELYSNIDRHEMILYAKYLATKINALLHDTDHCSHQEKKLKDDLYKKHLELAHYKESIRSFLITSQAQEIGIIFSHKNTLEYANDSAKKIASLIGNNQSHPLLQSLKNSARYVERYQTPYNCYTCDGKGNRYMITAVYNHQGNNCIISISRADLTESISQKIALLNNPTRFDYLLYLETTKPGHRINTLIPGSAPDLLNFKVDLLEAALSKKATLLQAPVEDLNELVNFLHETSSRQILHTIDGKLSEEDYEQLLFDCQKNKKTSLLEQLNNSGTLFIKNIDALDLKVQKQLADVIKYGFFTDPTNQKKVCINVRIICSTHKKLSLQVKEGLFYQELYDELKSGILTMPDLTLLKTSELADIASNYLKQECLNTIPNDFLITLFQNYKPTTLYDLKTMVFEHAQNRIDKIIQDNNYLYDIKPEIAQAMRLGKLALKDPQLMSQLWKTFKSQARIAEYLGVNRSSVNRRCKEYSLQ
ncbi:MAG: sigma 54-interacting transcriptional regulator [Candidatus Dependentiae bacterium]